MSEEEPKMLSKEDLTKILKDMKFQEEKLNPDNPVIECFKLCKVDHIKKKRNCYAVA